MPLEDFRIRLADVVDGVIEVLERRPDLRFTLDGQAIVLEDYLEVRPEMEGRLRALLQSGRIDTGPSYVIPDEFLVGSESLVRNLHFGRLVCARFGARPMPVAYLPDTFGHPAQLPQILRGFGLESMVFWRGLGDERERLGARFRWRAPDGSVVLSAPLAGGYTAGAALGRSRRARAADPGGNAAERVEAVLRRNEHMLADPTWRDLVVMSGEDHGPLQEDLPEVLEALQSAHPGVDARIASLAEAVDALGDGYERLPEYAGELVGGARANVLRGVNSTRFYLKRENERCERELQAAETICALASLCSPSYRYPHGELRLAWRELLRNHPHDSICGCSVDETHDDMEQRFRSALRIARRVQHMALQALAGGDGVPGDNEFESAAFEGRYRWAYRPLPPRPERPGSATGRASLVNVLPFRRTRLVGLPLPTPLRRAPAVSAGGSPVQVEDGRGFVRVDMDGLSATEVRLLAEPLGSRPEPAAGALDGRTIENERYRVTVAGDGTLAVSDRRSGRLVEGLHLLEDAADRGDSYTFCPLEGDTPITSRAAPAQVRVVAAGPLYAELELEVELALPMGLTGDRRARQQESVPCPVRTRVRLAAGSERIEFRTHVTNWASDHRLRVRFPAPGRAGPVRAEGHYWVVPRPARPSWNGTWHEPPAPTQHTLGAVATAGLCLYTRGLAEYEALECGKEGIELALTLLRSVGWLSRDDLSTRRSAAGPLLAVPDAQCHGEHDFEYAIALGEPSDAELVRASQDYRFDLVEGPPGVALDTGLEVEGDAVLSALKGAEDGDGLIVRLYNPGPRPVRSRVRGPLTIERCRLDESELPGRPPIEGELTLRGGEIATLRARPA
jgi:mannosylglycerate hydrolase